jgi:hypothetical protein
MEVRPILKSVKRFERSVAMERLERSERTSVLSGAS